MKVYIAGIAVLACLFSKITEGSAYLLEPQCLKANEIGPKIAGGGNAKILSTPWMVMVKSNTICGGTLISSKFVLTAAHCISNEYTTVSLGEYSLNNPGLYCRNGTCIPQGHEVEVDKKIVHAEYPKAGSLKYDIALLRMVRDVLFSGLVRPICLIVNEQVETVSSFNITGWGATKKSELSEILKTATVDYTDRSNCNKKFSSEVDESQICTFSETSDSCLGDSGGPLSAEIVYNGNILTVLFGIISYGASTCDSVSVNTNVTHYMDWIVGAIQQYGRKNYC
ncbi:serine protease grass-like [Drosophila elegans]|uniref:serine protease grass-like n=1 Tax=Drosophila elegans TaxID=30023 RepID=UPI0007E836FB|nr:serine protease grass-like [Drosophila elegans]